MGLIKINLQFYVVYLLYSEKEENLSSKDQK